jgi:DNA-binding beta-propeller fold protein YncE
MTSAGAPTVFIIDDDAAVRASIQVLLESCGLPPYIEFDPDGNVANSFGDWKVVPNVTHGCTVDYENNFWTTGNGDGIIQKYSHNGKLLMQIGNRSVVDTSDGTLKGRALNSSRTQFYMPSDIAVDPRNGDVYVADGYGNSRVAVFDRSGKFLRQWGHQGTKEEARLGVSFFAIPDAVLYARYTRCNVVQYGGHQDTRSTDTRSAVADGGFTRIRSYQFCIGSF